MEVFHVKNLSCVEYDYALVTFITYQLRLGSRVKWCKLGVGLWEVLVSSPKVDKKREKKNLQRII